MDAARGGPRRPASGTDGEQRQVIEDRLTGLYRRAPAPGPVRPTITDRYRFPGGSVATKSMQRCNQNARSASVAVPAAST